MERKERLEPAEVAEVLALASAAGDADGAYPLAEDAVLHLRRGGEPAAVHLLTRADDGALTGYAQVDVTDPVAGAGAELVVAPSARRHGLGRALLTAALTEAGPTGRLRLWAHGDHPGAAALARALGFVPDRVLWQMRRSLVAPLPAPELPAGVTLRPFRPGTDDDAWLRLNARAFADHPEQGRWTPADLRARIAEPWFDPAGFLLAVRADELLGFHWTKVHAGRDPIGEVYVLGVDPAGHGLGLGTSLTLAGLRHLRGRGLDQAMLYVDESNRAATALYLKLGFARWAVDVSFVRDLA